jgi:hypothetical protein
MVIKHILQFTVKEGKRTFQLKGNPEINDRIICFYTGSHRCFAIVEHKLHQ